MTTESAQQENLESTGIEVFSTPASVGEYKGKEYIKVPISRIGTWQHPVYGEVVEDQEDFDQITNNWKSGVLGYEPPLYLGHATNLFSVGGEAAVAFLEDIIQEGDNLFGLYDPVDDAVKEDVRKGKYRYASPELARNCTNRETGEKVGTVLERHALTNEPFFTKLPRVEVVELERYSNPADSLRFVFSEQSTMYREEELASASNTTNLSSETCVMSTPTSAVTGDAANMASSTDAQVNQETSTKEQFSNPPQTTVVSNIAEVDSTVQALKDENLVLRQELADRDRKYADLVQKFSNLETTLAAHTETFRQQALTEKLTRLSKLNISAETKELYSTRMKEGMSADAEETMWALLEQLSTSETHKFSNVNGSHVDAGAGRTAGDTSVNPYAKTLTRLKKQAEEAGLEFNLPV
jgi:hypothetical protein